MRANGKVHIVNHSRLTASYVMLVFWLPTSKFGHQLDCRIPRHVSSHGRDSEHSFRHGIPPWLSLVAALIARSPFAAARLHSSVRSSPPRAESRRYFRTSGPDAAR